MKRYRSDEIFRNKVSLYSGAIGSLFFVVIQLYGGIRYQSAWFTALAVYNLLLGAIRFYLGLSVGKKGKDAWKTFLVVGLVLTVLNIALIVIISMMIADPKLALHDYSVPIAVANAFWTLMAAAMTIYSFMNVRKKNDPIALADRTVALVASAVSVLMLQTSLIASISGSEIETSKAYLTELSSIANAPGMVTDVISTTMEELATSNTITGFLVAIFAGGVTLYMVIRGLVERKKPGH